jgi:RNA polymerase sigma factor (sigma-70 family)
VRASLGDIERVYRSRGAGFFRLALAATGDVEAARDAVQEGFANAIRGRRSYRGTGSVEAWIARCVINAANDVTRHPRFASESDADPDLASNGNEPAIVGSAAELDASVIRAAVRRLPQRQRDALYLRFYLGFDYAAIAESLGIEVGTVSATLYAARRWLSQNLQEVAR